MTVLSGLVSAETALLLAYEVHLLTVLPWFFLCARIHIYQSYWIRNHCYNLIYC